MSERDGGAGLFAAPFRQWEGRGGGGGGATKSHLRRREGRPTPLCLPVRHAHVLRSEISSALQAHDEDLAKGLGVQLL